MKGQLKKESMLENLYDLLLFEPEKARDYHVLDDMDIIIEIGGKSPEILRSYREWKAENRRRITRTRPSSDNEGLEDSRRDDPAPEGLRPV